MFVNPLMLLGVSLAVLPIVVHLLSRSRYRSVDWGAMMFLDGAAASRSHSRRLNQWLLLLIRGAIIALLAFALARPEIQGKFASTGSTRRGVAAILLDCSASMKFDENGHSRMDLAREAAKQVLSLHRGDRVSLVLMGQNQPRAERTPTADLWDVGRRIESATPGFGRAEIARALDEALEAVEARDAAADRAEKQRVTFYLVTDRQAGNWKEILDGGEEWANAWKQRLARAGSLGRVVAIPIGSQESENVLVQSIELLNEPAISGQAVELEVKLQNFGPVQWASMPLTVLADRRIVFDQRVNLLPDSTASFRVNVPNGFAEPGSHVVTAEINRQASGAVAAINSNRPSNFASDDRLEAVIDVLDPIRVLVVTGDEVAIPKKDAKEQDKVPPSATETAYFTTALTPFRATRKKTPDPFVVELANVESWLGPTVSLPPPAGKNKPEEHRLSNYRVVVLSNLERVSDAQLNALDQFIYEGGGVLIAPGELSRVEEYNLSLFRDGAGFLPAALAEPTSADWIDQTSLLGFDAAHPLLKFLEGRPDPFLSGVVGRYFPVERISPQARVLMRYASGDPFLIESPPIPSRRGRVLLMTTPLGADWSTLPLTSFYLPFAQSAIRYLAEGMPRRLNLAIGEPIEVAFDEQVDGRVVRVRPPDSTEERPTEFARPAAQLVARYTETETPGLYTARITEPGKKQVLQHFAVTASLEESNLAAVTPTDWRRLESVADVQLLDPTLRSISDATALPAPLEIWPWAIAAVFVLAVLEMRLARLWGQTEVEVDSAG